MPDAEFRGRITGLKEELSAFFVAQLTLQRELKNEGCPRSDDCLDLGVLQEQWSGADGKHEVERCRKCGRLRSVVIPAHLAFAAANATELDLVKTHGYSSAIEFTPFDWECLKALESARRESEMDERQQAQKDADMQRREAEFHANTQRMRGK